MPKLTTIGAPRNTERARSREIDVILGVDPGYAALGLALVWRRMPGRYTLLHGRTLRPEGDWGQRAGEIGEALAFALTSSAPGALAIEDQKQAQVAQAKRGQFTVANLSVHRVVGFVLGRCGDLPTVELPPSTWKKYLGVGCRADKAAVRAMVQRQVSDLPARMSEHLADAIGIAIGGFSAVGRGG